MNRITLENYRCFREKQDVPLAPLTLLVGDNSTGKTSFLAMIRALWQIPSDFPSFQQPPYDLGSFDDIAHFRGGRGGRADSFCIGFDCVARKPPRKTRHLSAVFRDDDAVAFPVVKRLSMDDSQTWIKVESSASSQSGHFTLGTKRGKWSFNFSDRTIRTFVSNLPFVGGFRWWLSHPEGPLSANDDGQSTSIGGQLTSIGGAERMDESDRRRLRDLADPSCLDHCVPTSLYAGTPVHFRPRRTYDPSDIARNPEGDHVDVSLYFANMSFQESNAKWKTTKERLESFGKQSGLFDEISVMRLGMRNSEPFQLQIRTFGSRAKGPMRNLTDVGYGVSQALPVLAALLRHEDPAMLLFQQPESHLHPSAQAALGSFFCRAAANGHQLIVETHSDHLLDRIRMDVRDETTGLRPDDVAILFFEKQDLDVKIHSLRIDKEGNINHAPPSYRRFFMAETKRSLRL